VQIKQAKKATEYNIALTFKLASHQVMYSTGSRGERRPPLLASPPCKKAGGRRPTPTQPVKEKSTKPYHAKCLSIARSFHDSKFQCATEDASNAESNMKELNVVERRTPSWSKKILVMRRGGNRGEYPCASNVDV
jgi:hypothetical protein